MPRTTTDKKSKTIILRINDECREYIEKEAQKEDINVSEYLRRQIEDIKSGMLRKSQNVMDDYTADEFKSMCVACRIDTKSFFRQTQKLFNDGLITVDCGIVNVHGKIDSSSFEEACERTNQDPQYIIDRVTEKILKG